MEENFFKMEMQLLIYLTANKYLASNFLAFGANYLGRDYF